MIEVVGVAFGLILANKLVGLHMNSKLWKQAVEEELKIIK